MAPHHLGQGERLRHDTCPVIARQLFGCLDRVTQIRVFPEIHNPTNADASRSFSSV